jgi:hypothetical protein
MEWAKVFFLATTQPACKVNLYSTIKTELGRPYPPATVGDRRFSETTRKPTSLAVESLDLSPSGGRYGGGRVGDRRFTACT